MLDIQFIHDNQALVKKAAQDKKLTIHLDELLIVDKQRRQLGQQIEELHQKQNSANTHIATLDGDQKTQAVQEMKTISDQVKKYKKSLQDILTKYHTLMLEIPNIPASDVPQGKSDHDNVVIKTVGDIPHFDFPIRDHIELGHLLDIIDIPRGVKIAGSRSYVLKGDGARLELALIQFATDFITSKGFTLFNPPVLVNTQMMFGTGFFPGGEDQCYNFPADDLSLVGTAEVPVMGYYQDETLPLSDLPKYSAGFSPCFRREAGTYGKDTHGLFRVHQFYKVEQTVICEASAEESRKQFQILENNTEEILKQLGIPYRIMNVCTGDLGKKNILMHDIESWMPSRNQYGETHSCSILHDFQARRLNLKYQDQSGKKHYCHTLNNTVLASPRILIPILELNQNPDGSINIPPPLRPYMQNQEKITP